MAEVRAVSNILQQQATMTEPVHMKGDSTIEDCYLALKSDPRLRPMVKAMIQGRIIEDWSETLKDDQIVIFAVMPAGGDGGGKTALAAIASIAIMVFAAWAGPALAAKGGAWLLGMSAKTAGAVYTAAIGIVGALAVGAIFKPPSVGLNAPTLGKMEDPAAPNPIISGQSNQARQGGVIPVIFGEHTVFPDLAAVAYVEKKACRQVLHAIYCLGVQGVQMVTGSMKLGGVSWDKLAQDNPGMDYNWSVVGPATTGTPNVFTTKNFGGNGMRGPERYTLLIRLLPLGPL